MYVSQLRTDCTADACPCTKAWAYFACVKTGQSDYLTRHRNVTRERLVYEVSDGTAQAIGVGIVLISVSGIAWRLTSHDAPSCRAMLGLHSSHHEPNRRFVPRVPPYGGRPSHHPYAAMMYPEFQYRPPPPSYQASMQEYRLRLLLLDRHSTSNNATSPTSALSPVSPPPTYRSAHNAAQATTPHARPPLTLTEREYSRPPSYRSRASSAGILRPSTETLCSLTPTTTVQPLPASQPSHHSRNPSLSLSFLSHESLFLDSGHSRPQQQNSLDSINHQQQQNSLDSRNHHQQQQNSLDSRGHLQQSLVDSMNHQQQNSLDSRNHLQHSDSRNHHHHQSSLDSGHSRSQQISWTVPGHPSSFASPSGDSVVGGLSEDGGSSPMSSWRTGVPTWKHNDINAVTIVQTTDSSQVLNRDSVVLSVPGNDGEVRILAHV
ncbi:hypothetical protein JTE90_015473 [Oedothorax gibbosus]|uniref:Uncharacterized protein n=1 Tax=Oedothorax gibbosus TaxID=931172 RepID=A0AAV6UKN6_9ARAC|nr:hypothetical protein JTE90_015473 [Oedothorax gibbosus]